MEPLQFSDDFEFSVPSSENPPVFMDGVLIDGLYFSFEELVDMDTAPSEQPILPEPNIGQIEQPTAEVVVAEAVVGEVQVAEVVQEDAEAMDEEQEQEPPTRVYLYLAKNYKYVSTYTNVIVTYSNCVLML